MVSVSNMATQTDGGGRGVKDKTGTSSWAGIVGGGKNDTPGDASKPPVEEKSVNPEPGEGAAGAPCGAAAPQVTDLDPEELSQFTEIRTKKDRAKKKEAVRGGRKDKRGGRREYGAPEWEPRADRGEGVPRGRGGKRPGRELPLRQQNGPEGEEEGPEESVPPPEAELEEKVLYVPAPAPSVNIWEKRQNIPAPAPTPAPAPAPAPVKPAGCSSTPAVGKYSSDEEFISLWQLLSSGAFFFSIYFIVFNSFNIL